MCCRIGSVDGKLVCCGATIHIGILPFGWFCTALGKLCSPLYHSCQPWVTNHHIILKWLTSLENMFYSWEKCFLICAWTSPISTSWPRWCSTCACRWGSSERPLPPPSGSDGRSISMKDHGAGGRRDVPGKGQPGPLSPRPPRKT